MEIMKICNKKNVATFWSPKKVSTNLCQECIPKSISFKAALHGFCEKCAEEGLLMTIINYDDEIDQQFYHDIGGEG